MKTHILYKPIKNSHLYAHFVPWVNLACCDKCEVALLFVNDVWNPTSDNSQKSI